MTCFVKESWSSASDSNVSAYDAWIDKLKAAQGSDWCPGKRPSGSFNASLRHKVIGELNVIESRCDPCSGFRTKDHAARIDEPSVILLSYLEGGEHIEFGGQRFTLAAGDTFVWDSAQATRFEVYEPLHKVALAMPARLLSHDVISALQSVPRKFDLSSGSRFLLNNLIRGVADRDFDDADIEASIILDAVNTFVLGAARAEGQPDESLRQRQRREIIRYIEQHLTDPALSIGQIADLHRISKRYLHWLFREEAMTVNEFIISRRLQGCRKELINPDAAHRHVSQIAYAWGFANLSHFSKRYRAQFGESPTETRRTAVCS